MSRWRAVYLIAANTAILVLLIELAAHAGIVAYRASKPAFGYDTMTEPVRRNYAHMSPSEIDELWRDTLRSRWRYEPIVGFVTDRIQSRYVNVSAEGIRSNGGPANAVDGATWFFGGSTTFGYGVTDTETVPAMLERTIGSPVVNFGVPAHYSLHENRLLNHYLRLGFRPSRVIFLDGVNESCEADLAEDELGELVAASQRGYSWQPARPVVYAVRLGLTRLLRAVGLVGPDPDLLLDLHCHAAGRDLLLAEVHARALAEREASCTLYGLECRTYIQPFAGLHGLHEDPQTSNSAEYLRALYFHLEPVWRRSRVTFVTHALDPLARHAYVDDAHYSADANRSIASAIAGTLTAAPTTGAAPSRGPLPDRSGANGNWRTAP